MKALAHEETPRQPIGYNLKTEHELQLNAMYGWDQAEISKRFKIDLRTVYLTPPEKFRSMAVKSTVSTSVADSFLLEGKDGLHYDEWGVGYSLQMFPYRFVGSKGQVSMAVSSIPKMVNHPKQSAAIKHKH